MVSMTRSLANVAFGFMALAILSCDGVVVEPGPGLVPPGPERVAELRVDASQVLVNGESVAGRVALFDGDKVATGATGRATIFFDAGGTLELEPNTDPLLRLISQAGCVGAELVAYLRNGTFNFDDVSRVCFCNIENEVCGMPQSDFRVAITDGGASIVVTSGSLLVTVGLPRPRQEYLVRQDEGIQVRNGRTEGPRPVIR